MLDHRAADISRAIMYESRPILLEEREIVALEVFRIAFSQGPRVSELLWAKLMLPHVDEQVTEIQRRAVL